MSTDKNKTTKRNIKRTKEIKSTQVPCIDNEQILKSSELSARYFSDPNENESTLELDKEKLTRILTKLEKAKRNLNSCSGNAMENAATSTNPSEANDNTENEQEAIEPIKKRPKLGLLPSFIPIG